MCQEENDYVLKTRTGSYIENIPIQSQYSCKTSNKGSDLLVQLLEIFNNIQIYNNYNLFFLL